MRNKWKIKLSLLALAVLAGVVIAADSEGFIDAFDVKPQNFASVGHNDYFNLESGDKSTFEGYGGR